MDQENFALMDSVKLIGYARAKGFESYDAEEAEKWLVAVATIVGKTKVVEKARVHVNFLIQATYDTWSGLLAMSALEWETSAGMKKGDAASSQ